MPESDLSSSSATATSGSQLRSLSVTMIVGMHRSGTSFLTGSLQQAGLELGKFSHWNPHNLKGNRENTDIVAINDAVLAAHGCSWDNPPTGTIEWPEEQKREAQALVERYEAIPHWGFKDPRSVLVLEGWKALIPQLRFVGIFRHPNAVAKSLEARGGMPIQQAWKLWKNYNERLLQLHHERPFPILCFDEQDDILLHKLNTLTGELGLTAPQNAQKQDAFFDAGLKHQNAKGNSLPEPLKAIYQSLKDVAR